MKLPVVVLVSGGMDSVVALHAAHREHEVVAGLSFDYGSKHNHREIPFAREHCEGLGVAHYSIDLGFVGEHFSSALLRSGAEVPDGHYEEENMRSTVVPFRNGIMLAVAAGFTESQQAAGLVIAAHSGDHAIYPDCREEFMAAMGKAMALGSYARLRLLRPFIAMRKEGIVARGAEIGVDFARTWSCYKGDEIHCGSCATCVERREAFLIAGIEDPTSYFDTGPLPAKPSA